MATRAKRFTIFDALEERGDFDKNPANASSRDNEGRGLYKGPQKFPMLVYHPEGEEEIIVPATAENTPFGPKWLNEHRAIVHKEINSEEELKTALADGWHDHPAKAIAAGNAKRDPASRKPVPPISSAQTINDLQAQLEAAQAALALANANKAISESSKPAAPSPNPSFGEKLKKAVASETLV